jgi:hypothetical protein
MTRVPDELFVEFEFTSHYLMLTDADKLLRGIIFVAKSNHYGTFVLGSKMNDFGGWNVETVVASSGYKTHLLPLMEGQLDVLADKYPVTLYKWRIGAESGLISLQVKPRSGKFTVHLCKDMTNKIVDLDYLIFHICSEDAQQLADKSSACHVIFESMSQVNRKRVLAFIERKCLVPRRNYALLGHSVMTRPLNGLMSRFITLQRGNLMFCMDITQPGIHSAKLSALDDLDKRIVSLPNDFESIQVPN